MGHLLGNKGFQADFVSMDSILGEVSKKYEFSRTDAPYDSTAARFSVAGHGNFGIIANESEPFCRTCTRLRISSDGYLYGCLSSANRQDISSIIELPSHLALPKLQGLLVNALRDKKLAFQGEATVMKFIGG
jgi:cyclic pyranopterin phosphate synthase